MSDDQMEVDVDKLLKVIRLAIEELKAREGRAITLPFDWFWEVDRSERHVFDQQPTGHTIGSYKDAWEGIKDSADDGEIAFLELYLIWASYLLRELDESRLRD